MTHDEFQRLAAAGGPATPEQQRAAQEHLETCPECLSIDRETASGDLEGRSAAWWLAIPAVLFLALWIWREAAVRVAREQLKSERAEVVALKNSERVLKDQKEKLAAELAVISAPGVQMIAMTAPAGPAAGVLYVDPATHHAVLAAKNLAKTDADHDYELWLYAADGSAPKSAGIFDVTNGHVTLSAANVPSGLASASVTLENNGGAHQPGVQVALTGHP